MTHPLVTIGVPTYNRPELLKRALTSIAAQDYPNLEVLVADNCSPGSEVQAVYESFKDALPGSRYYRHAKNIGGLKNFFSLLAAASGKYFMWLADDDEISPNYISALVPILESNPDAATAMGSWVLLLHEHEKVVMPNLKLSQQSALGRAISFILKSNDAFFFGLHRPGLLRSAEFNSYWWPNNKITVNLSFAYLMDLVLNGKILYTSDPSVQFRNHEYTSKFYDKPKGLWVPLKFIIRRFNLYFLYGRKVAGTCGYRSIPPVAGLSGVMLCKDIVLYFTGYFYKRASSWLLAKHVQKNERNRSRQL